MTRTLFIIILVTLCLGLNAQWSTNAANPNLIYNGTSAQVMPKTAITDNGDTYMSWLDNSQGSYYTYLQRLNTAGTAEWATPLVVSNHTTDTWTTDWDIDADPSGNAVLTIQDLRLGTNNVVAYKIAPDGTFLWGADGIVLSNDTSTDFANMAPTTLCLSDGRTVVAWQRLGTKTSVWVQCISDSGSLLWGESGFSIASTTISYTWPQLLESDNGSVLLKYFEDSGVVWAPTRKILVQKYDPVGTAIWTNPTYVSNAGGISAWTQIFSIASDNNGGMILVWHDDRLQLNISYSYVQHIAADGSVTMTANGVKVSPETGFHMFYPKTAFDPTAQEIYVFWNRLNADQNNWSIYMQKISINGELLWAGNGMEIVPLGTNPTFPIAAGMMQNGAVLLYAYGPQSGNDQIANLKAFCTNSEGQPVWVGGSVDIATTGTQKLHYNADVFSNQWAVLGWEDGGGPSGTYAMRINADGSLGINMPTPFNLTAQIQDFDDILLTWEFPETFIPPNGYKIYRNSELIFTTTNSNTEYLIQDCGPGNWSFYVVATFEMGEDSPPSNIATVNITGIDDPENIIPATKISIYPNPFQNSVNFHFTGKKSTLPSVVSIYNCKGQIVYQKQISAKDTAGWKWDGKDLYQKDIKPGIYLIKTDSGQYSCTTKMIKY